MAVICSWFDHLPAGSRAGVDPCATLAQHCVTQNIRQLAFPISPKLLRCRLTVQVLFSLCTGTFMRLRLICCCSPWSIQPMVKHHWRVTALPLSRCPEMGKSKVSKMFRVKLVLKPGRVNQWFLRWAGSTLTFPADAPGGWIQPLPSRLIATSHGEITIIKNSSLLVTDSIFS